MLHLISPVGFIVCIFRWSQWHWR